MTSKTAILNLCISVALEVPPHFISGTEEVSKEGFQVGHCLVCMQLLAQLGWALEQNGATSADVSPGAK